MSVEEARTAQRSNKLGLGDWHDGYETGLREAARIVRERKDKHANLLSKNVLEIAAAQLDEIAGQANEGGV